MKNLLFSAEAVAVRIRDLARRPDVRMVTELAAADDLQVYLVGGAVRELLLGQEIHDLDLAVNRRTLEVARTLAERLGGTFVLLDEQERSARVVWQGQELDLTEFRAPDLAGDLQKRDFTVNAMAIDLQALVHNLRLEIIDPWGGQEDLVAGRLELLLDENFRADPLRLLRAFRFAATHGLALTPRLREAITSYSPLIQGMAGERLHQEMFRLLAVPAACPVLRLMAELGFLDHLLPELADMKGVIQNGYHHLDVFEHSLTTMEHLERVLAAPGEYFQATAPPVGEYARQGSKPVLLKLAALFHDAGKPATQTFRADQERYTFYHHERLGMEIFGQVASRWRFSLEESRTVNRLIELHMRPFHLLPEFQEGTLSQRALGRFIKAARPELPGVLALAMADSLAGQGPAKPPDSERLLAAFADQVMAFLKERVEPMEQRPRLLTGADLIRELHLEPGPDFRQLLTAVEEAALEGSVQDRQQALALVADIIKAGKREEGEEIKA